MSEFKKTKEVSKMTKLKITHVAVGGTSLEAEIVEEVSYPTAYRPTWLIYYTDGTLMETDERVTVCYKNI